MIGLGGAGCAHRSPVIPEAAWERLQFSRPQMGVPFRIVVYATHEPLAQRAVEAAYARIAELNRIFSDYDPDSEVSRLCHDTPVGVEAPVSAELAFLIGRSQALAKASDGAFDITVGPLVNLWRRARRHKELPPANLQAEAWARVGWQHLRLDRRHPAVSFGVADMRLDFGGIAKGYAADEALRVLREHGFPRALIAAAGDVTAGDPPPGQKGWRVDIGGSEGDAARKPRTVLLVNAAIGTSGDSFQFLEIGGVRYSHILDPRTGIGVTNRCLVTVIAHDGVTSDSLGTAVSVLGPEAGLRLVERTPGAAALVVGSPEGGAIEQASRRLQRWLVE
ncbi:MAG: FAD:protein FMN transferase [Verrucomicrobiales bacterium]|nr:FAD:protein FMN transferase [Verrucomicrobiales bacterium]